MRHAPTDRRDLVRSATYIYVGATVVEFLESVVPGGGQSFSLVPGVACLAAIALLTMFGDRLPIGLLAMFGPLGVALIGVALTTTSAPGDGAVLYMWPVLWTAAFFGTRGAVGIIAIVALVHGIVVLRLPNEATNLDRWIDVVVATTVVALVVRTLAARNERLVARLATEARVDPLTGLLNRRGLDEHVAMEEARARRDGTPLAVAMFDLDHFKDVNDRFGHDAGDAVLSWMGMLLHEHARGSDVVARAGGEEFVVVLPRADAGDAQAFAERVRCAVRSGRAPADVELTVSAGVAGGVAPVDVAVLVDAADQALYRAKRAGRDRTESVGLVPSPAHQ